MCDIQLTNLYSSRPQLHKLHYIIKVLNLIKLDPISIILVSEVGSRGNACETFLFAHFIRDVLKVRLSEMLFPQIREKVLQVALCEKIY